MQRSRSLIDEVKRILFEEWDPIGVNDHDGCRDEYDSYAPRIAQYLEDGVDEGRLMDHLANLARISMSITKTLEARDRKVVKLLMDLTRHNDTDAPRVR